MAASEEFFGLAILLLSLCCLGTWPAILRFCSDQTVNNGNNRTRLLEFVYIDYATAYGIVSCVPYAFACLISWTRTSTANGDGSSDYDGSQQDQQSFLLIATAMIGGTLLSLGNLSFQWSTAVFGTTLTTTLAIQSSMTVVLGTFLNFALEPSATSKPMYLVMGVGVFCLAISLATRAQIVYAMTESSQNGHGHDHLTSRGGNGGESYTVIELPYGSSGEDGEQGSDGANPPTEDHDHHFLGLVPSNSFYESTYMSKQRQRAWQGIFVAVLGGFAFGFFSPCFNIALNDPFHWRGSDRPPANFSVVARTNAWFSLAFWLASCVGNVLLMRYNQKRLNQSTIRDVIWDYFTKDAWSERKLAFLAGIVCALGNVLQFQGGKLVGFATADLVQAFPLVSTIWDVLFFGEFVHVRCWSWLGGLLSSMYVAYLTGIVLLACSSIA